MTASPTRIDYSAKLLEILNDSHNPRLTPQKQLNLAQSYEKSIRVLAQSNNMDIVNQSLSTVLGNPNGYARQVVGVAKRIKEELNAKAPAV